MSYRDPNWLSSKGQLLMDIAVSLADYTQKLSLCQGIPAFLSQTLELEPLSLAIIREVAGGVPEIVMSASSGALAQGTAGSSFAQDLLIMYQQTRPLTVQDTPTLRTGFDLQNSTTPAHVSEMAVQHLATFPRATVITRTIDQQHRMLLVVHQSPEDPQLADDLVGLLQLVANQLVKLLACLMVWSSKPEEVGVPFDRLTEREWMVMRGLGSDAGEKQLADELGLSPHTLHSHIKSIYRKVGVQGRLPLLLRAEAAMRGLRAQRMQGGRTTVLSNGRTESSLRAPAAVG